jgi:hypothetical protein
VHNPNLRAGHNPQPVSMRSRRESNFRETPTALFPSIITRRETSWRHGWIVIVWPTCDLVGRPCSGLFPSLCRFRHVYDNGTITSNRCEPHVTLSSFTIFRRCRGRPRIQQPRSQCSGHEARTSGSLLSVARDLSRSRGWNHTDWGYTRYETSHFRRRVLFKTPFVPFVSLFFLCTLISRWRKRFIIVLVIISNSAYAVHWYILLYVRAALFFCYRNSLLYLLLQ